MTVCNACRYCEGFCPVFRAMERRVQFGKEDLFYLANLCHNCGECLYACQYAPPHEFGINVPRTLAELRLASYEESCWPRWLRGTFRSQAAPASVVLAIGGAAMWYVARAVQANGVRSLEASGDFYQVVPHDVMVAVFGTVALIAVIAMGIAGKRGRESFSRSVVEKDSRLL